MKLASVMAAFPVVGLALTSTVPVRVDAVFPRNNTVYQPLYPVPIVFAIHNFDKVWNYQPSIVWWLYRLDGDRLPGDTGPSAIDNGEIAWDNSRLQETWAPPPSMFLAINYTKHLQDAVPSRHSLRIQYNVGKLDCPPRMLFDEIFFSITNITTSDTMPDVKSFSGCPRPLGNFDVGIPPESNWTCSTTLVAEVSKLPCLFSGDQRTFDEVANKMVNVSGCLGATWPGGPNTTLPRSGIACKSGVPVKPSEGSQLRHSSAAIGLIFLSMGLAFITAG